MSIKCCNGCVPPKRNPYCHATCEDYIREKAEHEAKMEEDRKIRTVRSGLIQEQFRAVRNAAKGKRNKGGNYGQ